MTEVLSAAFWANLFWQQKPRLIDWAPVLLCSARRAPSNKTDRYHCNNGTLHWPGFVKILPCPYYDFNPAWLGLSIFEGTLYRFAGVRVPLLWGDPRADYED
jgi:hypothetical protein